MKRIALLVLAAAALSGCSAVYSVGPVGLKPVNLGRETAEWEGHWVHKDGGVDVRVADASNGVLRLAWTEEDDGAFKLKTADVLLRESGTWTFASMRDAEAENTVRYVWGRLQRDEQQVILWLPSAPAFREWVAAGHAAGTSNRSDVTLGALDGKALDAIRERGATLFSWDSPVIFRKTTR